ncbi:MAG: hypothetical protein ACLGHP_01500 [Vicinamibacteria bacterium]
MPEIDEESGLKAGSTAGNLVAGQPLTGAPVPTLEGTEMPDFLRFFVDFEGRTGLY